MADQLGQEEHVAAGGRLSSRPSRVASSSAAARAIDANPEGADGEACEEAVTGELGVDAVELRGRVVGRGCGSWRRPSNAKGRDGGTCSIIFSDGASAHCRSSRKEAPARQYPLAIRVPGEREIRRPRPRRARSAFEVEPGIAAVALAVEAADGFERNRLIAKRLGGVVLRLKGLDLFTAGGAVNGRVDVVDGVH